MKGPSIDKESMMFKLDRSDEAESFISSLPVPYGKNAGKKLEITPERKRVLTAMYGDDVGRKVQRKLYCRGEGATTFAAAIAIYELIRGGTVYLLAPNMAQARNLFDVALRMIEMTPALAKYCRARTTDMRVSCAKTEAYLQAASVRSVRPDSQNATAIICDGTGGFSQRDILSNLAGGGYEVHKKLCRFITFERVDDRWARG